MRDYSKGKIYKITNTVDDYYYIGSTTQKLNRRFWIHKSSMVANRPQKVTQYLKDVGWNNVRITLIEECPVETKKQMLEREQIHIDLEDKHCLNSINAIKDIERRAKWQKKWSADNKEHVKVLSQESHIRHRDRRLKENKERYDNGRKELMAAVVVCPLCGDKATQSHLNRHQKTKRCLNNRF